MVADIVGRAGLTVANVLPHLADRRTEPAASLTAEAGIAVFRVAFERWVDQANQRDLARLMRDSRDELKAVTAGARS